MASADAEHTGDETPEVQTIRFNLSGRVVTPDELRLPCSRIRQLFDVDCRYNEDEDELCIEFEATTPRAIPIEQVQLIVGEFVSSIKGSRNLMELERSYPPLFDNNVSLVFVHLV